MSNWCSLMAKSQPDSSQTMPRKACHSSKHLCYSLNCFSTQALTDVAVDVSDTKPPARGDIPSHSIAEHTFPAGKTATQLQPNLT